MTSAREYIEIVELLWPSLVTAAAAAIGGSLVGTFVQLRREGMAALALPQVVAIGAALGLRWGVPTLGPALVTAALAVMLLAWSKGHGANHWVLPSLFVAGLSLSFLIIANSGAHVAELQNLFTGIDVSVAPGTAMIVAPVVLAAGLTCAFLWRRWLLLAQMPAVSELAGLHPTRGDVLFLCLLATVLLFGTSALGAVMLLAMIFLPAATVLPWTRRIPTALVAGPAVGLLSLAIGFVLSIEMTWPVSQSVGGVGFVALVLSYGARALRAPNGS